MGVLAQNGAGAGRFERVDREVTKEAARKAGPSVVQIETRGGADMVVAGPKGQVFRKALGPTTGVVVDAEGYIITSAFNFINNPPIILVRVQGQQGDPLPPRASRPDKIAHADVAQGRIQGAQRAGGGAEEGHQGRPDLDRLGPGARFQNGKNAVDSALALSAP